MYLEIDFHLHYAHAVNSSKSQNQTYMTLRMDERIDKHSSTRYENKYPMNNGQHSCRRRWESSSFLYLPSSFCHWRMRRTDLKLILPSPSSWSDLTTTKTKKRPAKIVPWQRHHLRLNWCCRTERKVSMSSCRWSCWRRSCRPHLQQSRHRERFHLTLSPSRERRR